MGVLARCLDESLAEVEPTMDECFLLIFHDYNMLHASYNIVVYIGSNVVTPTVQTHYYRFHLIRNFRFRIYKGVECLESKYSK